MFNRKKAIWLCLLVLAMTVGTSVATLRSPSRNNSPARDQKKKDLTQYPIADFNLALPADPEKRAQRQKKSKKYEKALEPLTENTEEIFSNLDWESGLPGLPVAKSDAVVIGKVTDSQAYLSTDKTGVYSEFTIRIEEVVKNDNSTPLSADSLVAVERSGGRVRLPSGNIALVSTRAQGMPRVGQRYVFFLTHNFPLLGRYEDDFYILTGYELRDQRIVLLDNPGAGHPITSYQGANEASFLNELRSAIGRP